MQSLTKQETERLDTARQLADYLNVTPAAVRRWSWLRKIPVIRAGRCVRYDRHAVLDALQRLEPRRRSGRGERGRRDDQQ